MCYYVMFACLSAILFPLLRPLPHSILISIILIFIPCAHPFSRILLTRLCTLVKSRGVAQHCKGKGRSSPTDHEVRGQGARSRGCSHETHEGSQRQHVSITSCCVSMATPSYIFNATISAPAAYRLYGVCTAAGTDPPTHLYRSILFSRSLFHSLRRHPLVIESMHKSVNYPSC